MRTGKRVAVLGAGPIGLDAALAGLDAGWDVTVHEAAPHVGAGVRAWGHVRLFTPWPMAVSHRMRAHLAAAGADLPAAAGPDVTGDRPPTGHEFAERILDPLAGLPALAEVVHTGHEVLGVARRGRLKHEAIGAPERADSPFRLLLSDGTRQWNEEADVVLDCTGNHGRANPLGDGGLPAPGEDAVSARIARRLPDLGFGSSDRAAHAGRRTLLVGAGKSAQTAARDLARLAATEPGTRVLWAVRSPDPGWGAVPDDSLPDRQALVDHAESLRAGAVPGCELRTGVTVEDLAEGTDGAVVVGLRDTEGTVRHVEVDQVLGLTGYLGDTGLYAQLQVHECYATAAPMNLAASLLAAAGDGATDCLTAPAPGIETLRSPEPDFFVLGMKSYGRDSSFLLRTGYAQVDEVVAAYGGRR